MMGQPGGGFAVTAWCAVSPLDGIVVCVWYHWWWSGHAATQPRLQQKFFLSEGYM